MQICVHLDSARLFRWHLALVKALSGAGHDIVVSFVDTPEPLPTSLTAVLDYDQARSRAREDRYSTRLQAAAFSSCARYAGGRYDLMIDLSSATRVRTHPGRVLRPLYDGSFKDYALFNAVLSQQAPSLALADSASRDHVWTIGQPAIETPWRPAASLDSIAARLIEGLTHATGNIAAGHAPPQEKPEQTSFAARSTVLSATLSLVRARLGRKAARMTEKLSGNAAKWHVAWRRADAAAPPEPGLLRLGDWRILADGGHRYFADPFVYVHDGLTHVFVEEVPDATGRGIVSHFTLSPSGEASPVAPVLDTGSHVSYPFVFADGGDLWMLPESSAAGGLDLYRAARFPDRWEKAARLIEGRVHDATLFRHQGRLWIAAGSEAPQSSSWDGLSLYSAQTLHGPWHAHAGNPVLVDAGAARPAGALWQGSDDALMRPAQDCTHGYGSRLTLRRVTQLDDAGFSEETAGWLAFQPEAGILGPHTLSRGGGFELIDLFARPSALRAGYRA